MQAEAKRYQKDIQKKKESLNQCTIHNAQKNVSAQYAKNSLQNDVWYPVPNFGLVCYYLKLLGFFGRKKSKLPSPKFGLSPDNNPLN